MSVRGLVKSAVREVSFRADSWVNAMTGLGDAVRDKLMSTRFQKPALIPLNILEDLYHGYDIAAIICDKLPRHAMRQWFKVAGDDAEDLNARVQEQFKRLGFRDALLELAVWSRVYGGALIYMGINDGAANQRMPVREPAIRSIDFLHVLDPRSVQVVAYYSDPTQPKFGKPEVYRVTATQVLPGDDRRTAVLTTEIHETRLLRLDGTKASINYQIRNNGWSPSALQRPHEVMVQFNVGWQGTAHLLQDAAQGVFKISGLMDMIAGGEKEILATRMELVDMSRSMARAIMVDAEGEDFTRASYTFAGVPEVLEKFMLRLACAVEMPVSVLMGQAPAGLNATGESDMRIWYDQVKEYQGQNLDPVVARFITLLGLSGAFALPKKWSVTWGKLWQPTDKEQAEIELLHAQKDKILIDGQVVLPEEIALSRYPAEGFNPHTTIDLEARRTMLQDEIALALDKAGEPDPVPVVDPQGNAKQPVDKPPGTEPTASPAPPPAKPKA